MAPALRRYLASLNWQEGAPPPLVHFGLFFDGNTEEESIAPNQWEEGRPPIAALYARFKEIAARPDVTGVMVGLHPDWEDPDYADTFPPAATVHIVTSASVGEVQDWVAGLHADGVTQKWPYGKPGNAPEVPAGSHAYTVCWD